MIRRRREEKPVSGSMMALLVLDELNNEKQLEGVATFGKIALTIYSAKHHLRSFRAKGEVYEMKMATPVAYV